MVASSRADIVKDLGPIQIYGDGSVHRLNLDELDFSAIPVMNEDSVFFKDFTYDEPRNLQLCMYKPKSTAAATPNIHKLPIIVYIHRGGFCFGSRAWPNCHNSCLRLTSTTAAAVVAPDFGLSPEHRLPVIFHNVVRAVRWIGGRGGHEWLREGEGGGVEIDLERVFVVGDSSGGTLAHHLAVRLGSGSLNLEPVRGQGLRDDFALLRWGCANRIGEGFDRAVVDFGLTGLVYFCPVFTNLIYHAFRFLDLII